jgi:adenosylcobinamide-GDP ribazoletransferase
MSDLRAALGFLTVLPGTATPTPTARRWFPAVGALVGLCVGATWWVTDAWWPPLVAAALTIAADLAITGMLHVDGLADSADGLLPHAPRERRLEIMADPGVGTFGLAAVGAVLLARFAAIASMPVAPGLVVGLWIASRAVVTAAPDHLRYARPGGAATMFVSDGSPPNPLVAPGLISGNPRDQRSVVSATVIALAALAIAAVVAAIDRGAGGGVAVVACVCGAIAVLALAARRLGGFTGDVLGAAIVLGETVGLVVAAARW